MRYRFLKKRKTRKKILGGRHRAGESLIEIERRDARPVFLPTSLDRKPHRIIE